MSKRPYSTHWKSGMISPLSEDLPGSPYVHFFFAAEAEYGAFYGMPMLAEILNQRHGFTVSVSYSLDSEGNVDSRVKDGLRGFELLEHADLEIWSSLLGPEISYEINS